MANVQIPNLPAATSLNGSEQVEVVQAGTSVRTTTGQIAALQTGATGPAGPPGPTGPTGPIGTGGALGLFGSFFDTTDQTGSLTPKAINIGSVSAQNGVTLSNSSRVNFSLAGTYSITFSLQFVNTDNNVINTADVWLQKNGVAIPDTNSKFDIPGRHSSADGATIGTVNFVLQLNAGDYIEMFWAVSNTQVRIDTIPSSGSIPRTPGVIFTATQVTYTQVGLYTFDTVSDLLADTTLTYSSIAMGQLIYVSNGWYIYSVASSGATNNQLVTAGGLKLYVLPSQVGYNPKAFGAVGDGVTDDTVAVHGAFNAGIANKIAVCFPAGNYRVTSGYTNSLYPGHLTMRGESRQEASIITLDSTSSSRFFYDYTGGSTHYLTVEKLNFVCAQQVTDTDFFRFSTLYYGNYRFKDVIFQGVNRPIVFKAGTYQDTCEFIGVAFNDSGTIYSDSNVGSRGNLLTLIDVSHNGSIPANTAKQVMNLQGFRGIQATNLLLQGNLPSAGWTVLYLDNEYSVDWTQDNILQANGFWSEWGTNAPLYVIDQKGGRTLWNNAQFSTQITASGTQSIIRLRESAQMQINNASFTGNTFPSDPIENMFSFEDTKCHAVLNRCMIRYINNKNNVNFTYINCSYANNGTAYIAPVASALFGTQQSAVAFRWAGGYVATYGGSLSLSGGTTATPSTDATYGRKYILTPSGNTLIALFTIGTRGFLTEGTQYNIIVACKLPTFTGGYFAISPFENGVECAGGGGYYVSDEVVTLNISRRLGAGITTFGPRFTSYATGVSGTLEVYALAIYIGNDSPRLEYLQQATAITTHAPAAPTAGSWAVGDRVLNSAPAVGQPKSWVCTVAGTPGTWVSEGNL